MSTLHRHLTLDPALCHSATLPLPATLQQSEAIVRDVIRGGAIVYGLLAAGFSALAALLLTVLAIASGGNGNPAVMTSTVIVSLVVLGCGLGLPLALAGWHSLQGRASPRLRLPPIWLLLLVFVGALGLGTLVLHARAASAVLLPPLHVIASAMPPLILAAAVLPSLQVGGAGLTRRNFVAMLAYGGLFATAVAITLESIAALAAMGLAVGISIGSARRTRDSAAVEPSFAVSRPC